MSVPFNVVSFLVLIETLLALMWLMFSAVEVEVECDLDELPPMVTEPPARSLSSRLEASPSTSAAVVPALADWPSVPFSIRLPALSKVSTRVLWASPVIPNDVALWDEVFFISSSYFVVATSSALMVRALPALRSAPPMSAVLPASIVPDWPKLIAALVFFLLSVTDESLEVLMPNVKPAVSFTSARPGFLPIAEVSDSDPALT